MERRALEIERELPRPEWDAFAREHAWFWATPAWHDFMARVSPDRDTTPQALGVRDGDRLVAVAPFALERDPRSTRGALEMGLGGGPCWAPAVHRKLLSADIGLVVGRAIEAIDTLAQESGVERTTLALSPLYAEPSLERHFSVETLRRGYADHSLPTRVLDLERDEDVIWHDFTKGHRHASRAAERIGEFTCSRSAEAFEAYRDLYVRAAGPMARPVAGFDLLARWLGEGDGVVALATVEGRARSAAYVLVSGNAAYYSWSATDPEWDKPALGHALQWCIIRWLRARGVRLYELGLQHDRALPYLVPTEKERSIAKFKRGFGGYDATHVVRERFYSSERFEEVSVERDRAYRNALEAAVE